MDDELMMVEEHLDYDESEMDLNDCVGEGVVQGTAAEDRGMNEATLRNTNESPADQLKLEVEFDSEAEGEVEEAPKPKYVYSWKELYKPKQAKPARKMRKINEYRPKPNFVPHTCYICDSSYEDATGLETHLEGHVDLLPFKCDQCSTEQVPQEFKTLFTLNKHMQMHLYPYVCDFCPLRQLTMERYEEHMRRNHDEQPKKDGFTCDYCGRHFVHKYQFRSHHMKHVAMEEGRYKCEYCGKVFCNSSLLKRHRRIHTGEMPFECNKCGRRFNHEDNFKNHKRQHINEKGHICADCGKSFVSSTMLRYHMAEHYPDDPKYRPQPSKVPRPRYTNEIGEISFTFNETGQKHYECRVEGCDYVATTYGTFFNHKARHELKYQCQQCHKRFHLNSALQKHIAVIHEGKLPGTPFSCQYCPRTFSTKQYLRRHVDSHENNRRFKCQYCDKSFVQKVNLTAHERIHTGERPHACRFCPAAFITSSCRRKHEKTHTKGGELQQEDQEDEVSKVEIEDEYEDVEEIQPDD